MRPCECMHVCAQVDGLNRRVTELLGGSGAGGLSRGGSQRSRSRSPRPLAAGGVAAGSGSSQAGRGAGGPLALPLEWEEATTDTQQQQQQQGELEGDPSTEQIFRRISSSSSGRCVAGGAAAAAADGGAAASSVASAEKGYLAHQIAALRISLAKRDADVARLEGEGQEGGGGQATGCLWVLPGSLRVCKLWGSADSCCCCCLPIKV